MDDILTTDTLEELVNLLIRLVEVAGAIVIFTGATVAFARFLLILLRHRVTDGDGFSGIRLSLGRFLILGLEFQLASDILRTAVSPNFKDLVLLVFVATIRTALNYVLRREIREEEDEATARQSTPPPPSPPPDLP